MPDVNLLKNTEKYDPQTPKPTAPVGPGPLSDPELESKGFGGMFRSLFARRPKMVEPKTPVLGQASSTGRMSLGKSGTNERILNEKKSKPTMIQLPEDEVGGFNVNLLGQDSGQKLTLKKQAMKLGLIALGSAAIVGLVYFGLVYYNGTITTDIDEVNVKINDLRKEVSSLEKTQAEVVATTKKITAIRSLIDRHVHWTKFFTQLEKATGPEIFYGSSFSGDLNGTVTLAARAPSFEAVATQYLFFQQAVERGGFIQSFDISGAVASETKTGSQVNFTVALKLLPSVFYQTLEEAKAANSSTSTDAADETETNRMYCLVKEDQTLLQYFPTDLRDDVQAAAGFITCGNISESDRTRLVTEIKTDGDQDGVNALLERLGGTSDAKSDTDGDGISDLTDTN